LENNSQKWIRAVKRNFCAAFAASLCTLACATAAPDLVRARRDVAQYVESGRYEADIARVTASATAWIEERARGGGKLALVVDIDETALSDLEALRANDFSFLVEGPCDELPKGPCGIRAYNRKGQNPPIKPTLQLARRARELGLAVFFITGRGEVSREATEKNLRAAGYEWTALAMKSAAAPKAAADFKPPERRKIEEQGYRIVANIGDQESDLAGGYAERTFKLPNPFYFIP
jgi:acid phosphatase